MHRVNRSVLLFGVLLWLSGCSDMTVPGEPPSAGSVGTGYSAADIGRISASLDQVTRAIAVALDDTAVRLAVRDAMRDSPWNEHQVTLQELLPTAAGQALVAAAAQAAGESPAQFRARIAALPALAFYVPSRAQRRSWRGTGGIVVVSSLNFEDPGTYGVHGYGPDGRRVPDARAFRSLNSPVMVLHPAEPRVRRQNAQPDGGEVIEAGEGPEQAFTFRWIEPDGTVITPDLGRVLDGRDPRFQVLASSATGNTNIGCIKINFGDGGHDAELILKARFYDPDGGANGTGEYSNYSFPENGDHCAGLSLIARVIPEQSPAKINVEVWEDDCDCFGNNDDYYGSRDFVVGDRGYPRSVPATGTENARLTLDWVPISPSVFTSVRVSGAYVYVGSSTGASAKALDQYGYGLPGYSVSSWWTDHPTIATVSATGSLTASVFGHSVGTTTLYATISGITGSGPVEVTQSTSGCLQEPCPQ